MKVIIVDDEPLAIDIIKRYVDQLDSLVLSETFRDPFKALQFLQTHEVDLVFMDINMPGMTGVDLFKSLVKRPLIVFTTAHSQYAVESYNVDAVDYLVKPIVFERFLQAVNKAVLRKRNLGVNEMADETLLLKSGGDIHRVKASDITMVRKDSNYLEIHTTSKKILLRGTMTEIFSILPESLFARVHKSYVVSILHIDTVGPSEVIVSGISVPLSPNYRNDLLNRIGERK